MPAMWQTKASRLTDLSRVPASSAHAHGPGEPVTFGSLFTGIGGIDRGLERAGWECRFQVEIDPFCQRVLERRWPGVGRWGDAREFRCEERQPVGLGYQSSGASSELQPECASVDLLVGGFPCQDLSIAGKRAGLGGERSGLFWEIGRIAKIVRPTWGLFENVPGLLSSNGGRDMGLVLAGLRDCWPAVGYRILDSRYFGVAQRRRRVFFVCGPDEAGVASALFEPEGGGGDSTPGREAGAPTARGTATCVGVVSRYGKGADSDATDPLVIAAALEASDGHHGHSSPRGDGHDNLVIPIQYVGQWGRDKRQNGVGIGAAGDPSFTLDASYPHGFGAGSSVRRLTPTECERLQGFPDGWTCLCLPLDEWVRDPEGAAERCSCPDSPRYRSLGNAVTTTVARWLGARLATAILEEETR